VQPATEHPSVTRDDLIVFLRRTRYAVVATVHESGAPQAATVGIVTSDALELFFDTSNRSRKFANVRRDPRVAVVVTIDEATAQLEGIADEPAGDELARLKQLYFEAFPDGRDRERWEDIAYVRIRPTWARFSDFAAGPQIVTFTF
jgi:uncharacterized pyridoxamine 5'-phosphate oxidase family protein